MAELYGCANLRVYEPANNNRNAAYSQRQRCPFRAIPGYQFYVPLAYARLLVSLRSASPVEADDRRRPRENSSVQMNIPIINARGRLRQA
jgi:hypothetical protein